ncbi:tetratricopeptide repeat protein [Marisediminitalea sp.]|uniref:tetratricopeptide repeat protein n=1 Tax=Marisediminitalea sp. TaxID=2662268 RepID=UPI003516A240
MKVFLTELKRRNVIKSVLAYLGVSWLILQVVEVFSGLIDMHPLVGPGVILALTCGLPVVAYLSWHFDISLDGFRRTAESDDEAVKPLGAGSWLSLAGIAILSIFIGLHIFTSIEANYKAESEGQQQIMQADSIAVLPFTDQSPERDQNYLALGLSEELTSLLGRTEGFRVAASRSSQILSDKGLSPVEIGRRLNVQTVLAGSVRAQGNRLKIRVELIDTENGHTLWSEQFLRAFSDVFELESEIGRAVVNLLQDKYIEAGSFKSLNTTASTDAYVMYLKGKEQYRLQTAESMKAARTLFEQSIALDPEYAQAYVALADTIALLAEGESRFGILKTAIAAQLAKQNLDKAIIRLPDNAEAFAVKGYVEFMTEQYDTALTDLNKALSLNKNLSVAYMWRHFVHEALGHFEQALDDLEQAHSLDPISRANLANLGFEYSRRGDFQKAKQYLTRLTEDFPNYPQAYVNLADANYLAGEHAESLRNWLTAYSLSQDNLNYRNRAANILIELGLTEKAKQLVDATDPTYQSFILARERNGEALEDVLAFQVASNPDDFWVKMEQAIYLGWMGKSGKSAELFIALEDLTPIQEMYVMPFCSPAIEIAWAQQTLDITTATDSALIATCTKQLKEEISVFKDSYLMYLSARISALSGNSTAFVKHFSEALDNGWLQWWTEHDPLVANVFAENEQAKALLNKHNKKLALEKLKADNIDLSSFL